MRGVLGVVWRLMRAVCMLAGRGVLVVRETVSWILGRMDNM